MAAEHIAALLREVGAVAGARGIRSELSNVRRALRGRSPDKAKALKRLQGAVETYRGELAWRQGAAGAVLTGLSAYEEAIRDTIGLRKQSKLPTEQAVDVAGCMAYHRDISLNF